MIETVEPDQSATTLKSSSAQAGDQDLSVPAVEFRNVHFSFEGEEVLNGISFTVMRSEIKIILSGSGGGKSTILKLILGLLKPDEGQVLIDDEDITSYDESQLKRSEEHTSELQSRLHLVCRLLLEKKKKKHKMNRIH